MSVPVPQPVSFDAPDGYVLHGHAWRHGPADTSRPVVLINPATSVLSRYYARFAAFLHGHGFDVVTYDYRGIGGSRPPRLRGFEAGWIDWGQLDCEAALQYAGRAFPGQPVYVVAHSVGGFLVGLAPSGHRVARLFTMGAQYAHWRDYAPGPRLGMLLKWHLAMPALAALWGYFPGQRLGWLEDTPRGVVRDWTARAPRFEDIWRSGPRRLDAAQRQALVGRFAAVRADTLALGVADDPFGTVPAVQRLLACYRGCARTHLHLEPGAVGEPQIGHFAFFHSRFQHTLWNLPLAWLRDGHLPPDMPGVVTRWPADAPAPAGSAAG